MTSKLEIYNQALGHIGERKISALDEAVEARRVLDDYYDNVVQTCLENGFWNFATRAVSITASVVIDPNFGYNNAFEKPSDWVKTCQISENALFDPPLLRILDEADVWFADAATIYVQYVSNSGSYGMNLALWPETFTNYVSSALAARIAQRLTKSDNMVDKMENRELRMGRRARSNDAMNQPPGFPPTGTWVRSRGTGNMSRRSRWDGTTL